MEKVIAIDEKVHRINIVTVSRVSCPEIIEYPPVLSSFRTRTTGTDTFL